VVLSINGNRRSLEGYGLPIVEDGAYPAAGRSPASSLPLKWAEAIFGRDTIVVSMPADTPFIPLDLARRLVEGLRDNTDAAFAISLDRSHHAIAAWPVRIRTLMEEWLRHGETFAVKDFLRSRRAQPRGFRSRTP